MYNVKAIKKTMGREGQGFTCNLYKGNKKIAFCADYGDGGGLNIDWIDAPKLDKGIQFTFESDFTDGMNFSDSNSWYTYEVTDNSYHCNAHLVAMSEWIIKNDTRNKEGQVNMDIDSWVEDRVQDAQFKKDCKNKMILIMNDGRIIDITGGGYDEAGQQWLETEFADYANIKEIVNKRFL